MATAVSAGYAVSSTDTGHQGGSASFAPGHPEKLIDYAYRSEHEMTVASKLLIAAFYGNAPKLSYWNGCSAGGKQGLKEAQRYPQDFDGIVAGSPAANWVGRSAQSLWVAQAEHKDEASYIPPAKYPAIHRAVMAACDELDGVKDGVIENPRACKFDPQALLCKADDDAECLTAAQVETARKIYGDSTNPRTGARLYAGLAAGSELDWRIWGGPQPLGIGLDHFRYVVFENPQWDYHTLNFDRDITRAEDLDHDRIDALDPNLKPFFAHGGKLIQYHGWSDAQISPGNSLDYFESVKARMGDVSDSYRLFMVPSMGHCGGGEGATSFNAMPALEQWVEQKAPPQQIVAKRAKGGEADWTHPLCPYPQVAVYKGNGNPKDAANFVCKVR
jgi:feruloyl esterase